MTEQGAKTPDGKPDDGAIDDTLEALQQDASPKMQAYVGAIHQMRLQVQQLDRHIGQLDRANALLEQDVGQREWALAQLTSGLGAVPGSGAPPPPK
jgi:hypothetical protein